MTNIAHLADRAVLAISGEDRRSFLPGLVSNDVFGAVQGDDRDQPGRAVWTGLLTPQGKWLADFFVFDGGEALLLDTETAQRDMIAATLTRYRLRAKVSLAPSALSVFAAWDGAAPAGALTAADPRLPEAGWRSLASGLEATTSAAAYDAHRLRLGLPDGSRDLEAERSTLVEAGFDELHGIDWQKGCYMGQELTARTKYRGLVKRRLVRVRIEGALPAPGTPITDQGRAELGTLRSGRGDIALASLRLDAIRAPRLACGDAVVIPDPAPWMRWEPVQLATA